MPATGASIPPELFLTICGYVGTDDGGVRTFDKEGRRYLGTCALVCLEWARQCRFQEWDGSMLIVRSEQDMELLTQHCTSKTTRLTPLVQYITHLEVEQGWQGRSWCHYLYPILQLPRNSKFWVKLTLKGPIPADAPRCSVRSVFWSLPRTLPSCYAPYEKLDLTNIHFPSFTDVARVVRELRCLRWVNLTNVTWAAKGTFLPLMCRSWNRDKYEVWVKGSSDDALLSLQVYSALVGRLYPRKNPSTYPMLLQQDAENAFNVIRTVQACYAEPNSTPDDPPFCVLEDSDVLFPRNMPCECLCTYLGHRADPWDIVVRTYLTDPTFNMAVQQNLEVSCIAIEVSLTGPQLEGLATRFSWEVLKSSIVHLRALRVVIFAFRDQASVACFAKLRPEISDPEPVGQAKIRCLYRTKDEYSGAEAFSEVHPSASTVPFNRWYSIDELMEDCL